MASLNLHSFGDLLLFTEGASELFTTTPPLPCTVGNCSAPDLGAFFRFSGTRRSPRMLSADNPLLPFEAGSPLRLLYGVSGDSITEAIYGVRGPRHMALAMELGDTDCGQRLECVSASYLDAMFASLVDYITGLTEQLDEIEAQSPTLFPNVDLPHIHRRARSGSTAEHPALRVSVRSSLSNPQITANSVSGVSSPDDVVPGLHYTLYQWRPTGDPYTFPAVATVCGEGCRDIGIDDDGVVDLCDPARNVTDGFEWVDDAGSAPEGDECFWRLDPASSNQFVELQGRDLSDTVSTHLVFSHHWRDPRVNARVLVSSNGFSGCSLSNFGNCRVVTEWPYAGSVDQRTFNLPLRTETIDVSDFDGQSNVSVRIELTAPTDPTVVEATDFEIFDLLLVGFVQ